MYITQWNPFKEMDSFFNTYHNPLILSKNLDWSPSVDIVENNQEFTIKAELPEVKKEDTHVELNNGVLTINGERKYEEKDDKKHKIERFYGAFSRSFSLPDNIDENGIKAEQKEGMLYLKLPKSNQPKVDKKRIEIL